MSKGSSSTFVFFLIILIIGAILLIGVNELHHGFFGSHLNWLEDNTQSPNLRDFKSGSRDLQSDRRVSQPPGSHKPTKIDKSKLDEQKDALGRRDRAELNDLIDKVGK